MNDSLKAENPMLSQAVLDIPLKPVPIRFGKDAEAYKISMLHFAMNAGIEVTRGGRLFSCWIGGEDAPEAFLICSYSDDNGDSWKDVQFVIDPRSEDCPHSHNVHVAGLWRDPDNKLWLFYQQSLGIWDGRGAVFALTCDDPDAETPHWNEPFWVFPGSVIKKPSVLSNGEWIVPVSIWERWHITKPLGDCHHEYDNIRGANVFASKDKGKTWEYRGGIIIEDSCFNEHSVNELSDGRLLMTVRCNGTIKKTYSSDWGETWSTEEVYFPHVSKYSSMATIRKLKSGHLLLIKHGTKFEEATPDRTHLAAFISKDDGQTWQGGLLIDERNDVSYPEICQAEDGTIFVQYDRERYNKSEILFARFKEEDVLAAEFLTPESGTKFLIHSRAGINGVNFDLFQGAAEGFDGLGTETDPYKIANPEQLILLAKMVYNGKNFADNYFVQTNDVDFGGREIFPIGCIGRPFSGSYDGNGFAIRNVIIGDFHPVGRGLFGAIKCGHVKNITLDSSHIRGKKYAGGIVGLATGLANNPSVIENCSTTETVKITTLISGGGILGGAEGCVQIINCQNGGLVFAPRATNGNHTYIGGILGFADPDFKDAESKVVMSRCTNKGDVLGRNLLKAFTDAFCGGGATVTTEDCQNLGTVKTEIKVTI